MSADWFYSEGSERKGPVTEDELRRLADDGRLKSTDLVWRDGMADWVEAKTVKALFPKVVERSRLDDEGDPPPRRSSEVDRPSRRGRQDDEYREDDRPSRRGKRRDERDELDDDDDRPRVRRQTDDYEDYDHRPRSRRLQKPSQIQAVGIMLLIGGIWGILFFLTTMCLIFWWPPVYFELVVCILCIVRGSNMLGQDTQGPPKALPIMLIICILNGDIICCVLGIVSLVMISNDEVQRYYRKKGFY